MSTRGYDDIMIIILLCCNIPKKHDVIHVLMTIISYITTRYNIIAGRRYNSIIYQQPKLRDVQKLRQ